jgi:hypothetical protein
VGLGIVRFWVPGLGLVRFWVTKGLLGWLFLLVPNNHVELSSTSHPIVVLSSLVCTPDRCWSGCPAFQPRGLLLVSSLLNSSSLMLFS